MRNNSRNNSNGSGNGGQNNELRNATENFEKALIGKSRRRSQYILRLYVTGSTPRSLKAIRNLKQLCEEHLPDYDLEVIDIYENPNAAREAQIIAAPTLIKRLPEPLRRFVGDLSNKEKILVGLGISE
jgi:circadian clock protein KaiB